MTAPDRRPHDRLSTEEEYLALEQAAERRHEYVNGHVLAMAGADPNHELLCASVTAALVTALRGRPCFVFGSSMRVKVSATGLYTYPDVSALCGRPELEATQPQTLLNPRVLVEVLSRSTEAYDRGAKFQHYGHVRALQEYVLVKPDGRYVERYVRDGASWVYTSFTRPDDLVELPSIGAALRVGDVYEQVDALDRPPPPPTPRLIREGTPPWTANV